MLVDALVILIYICLIIFIITLIVLCIKLIGTLSRVDYLVENITRKAESLDAVFELIENTTNGYISGFIGKVFAKKRKNRKFREKENIYE